MNNAFHRLQELRLENDEVRQTMDDHRDRFEAMRTRHQDGTAPKAVSAFNLFQTPAGLAERMAEHIPEDCHTILEPSAGLGRLYTAARLQAPGATIHLNEINKDLSRELFAMTEDDEQTLLTQADFLEIFPAGGQYDCIIMNPPFKMRRDVKHIMHAFTHWLKPGGKLIALCLAGPIRERMLQPMCDTWEPIEAGTFAKEGTRVETVLLTMTKERE